MWRLLTKQLKHQPGQYLAPKTCARNINSQQHFYCIHSVAQAVCLYPTSSRLSHIQSLSPLFCRTLSTQSLRKTSNPSAVFCRNFKENTPFFISDCRGRVATTPSQYISSHFVHSLPPKSDKLSSKLVPRSRSGQAAQLFPHPQTHSRKVDSSEVTHRSCVTMASTSKAESSTATAASTNMPSSEDLKAHHNLKEIFGEAVNAGLPRHMLEKVLNFNRTTSVLTVEDRTYKIQRNVFVVGFGKAVLSMARVVDEILREHIIKGLVSIPKGCRADLEKAGLKDMLLSEGSNISVQEGAENNLPDVNAFRAARDIHKLISNLTDKDIVIVLMSGGGSALLPYPMEPLTMDDVQHVTRVLFSHGANISEVNTVRKHLEILKGGGLARAAMPAQVISLIISDVIGDSLEMIASGPTVRHTFTPHRCLEVIDRLGARAEVPDKVLQLLENMKVKAAQQAALAIPDPIGSLSGIPSKEKMDWSRVQNVLVGTNALACQAAASHAQLLGYETAILSTELSGEARNVGSLLAKLAQYISTLLSSKMPQQGNSELVQLEMELARLGISKAKLNEISSSVTKAVNFSRPLCVVAGGETVVTIKGKGKGGRNQEMVLAAALQLHDSLKVKERASNAHVFFLSAGTDGQDGPTDAAGALTDEHTVLEAQGQGLDPKDFLDSNDSYSFWSQLSDGRDLVITGFTGTNVMDIQLLLVKQQPHVLTGR